MKRGRFVRLRSALRGFGVRSSGRSACFSDYLIIPKCFCIPLLRHNSTIAWPVVPFSDTRVQNSVTSEPQFGPKTAESDSCATETAPHDKPDDLEVLLNATVNYAKTLLRHSYNPNRKPPSSPQKPRREIPATELIAIMKACYYKSDPRLGLGVFLAYGPVGSEQTDMPPALTDIVLRCAFRAGRPDIFEAVYATGTDVAPDVHCMALRVFFKLRNVTLVKQLFVQLLCSGTELPAAALADYIRGLRLRSGNITEIIDGFALWKRMNRPISAEAYAEMLRAYLQFGEPSEVGQFTRLLKSTGLYTSFPVQYTLVEHVSDQRKFTEAFQIVAQWLEDQPQSTPHSTTNLDTYVAYKLRCLYLVIMHQAVKANNPEALNSAMERLVAAGVPPGAEVYAQNCFFYVRNGNYRAVRDLCGQLRHRGVPYSDLYFSALRQGFLQQFPQATSWLVTALTSRGLLSDVENVGWDSAGSGVNGTSDATGSLLAVQGTSQKAAFLRVVRPARRRKEQPLLQLQGVPAPEAELRQKLEILFRNRDFAAINYELSHIYRLGVRLPYHVLKFVLENFLKHKQIKSATAVLDRMTEFGYGSALSTLLLLLKHRTRECLPENLREVAEKAKSPDAVTYRRPNEYGINEYIETVEETTIDGAVGKAQSIVREFVAEQFAKLTDSALITVAFEAVRVKDTELAAVLLQQSLIAEARRLATVAAYRRDMFVVPSNVLEIVFRDAGVTLEVAGQVEWRSLEPGLNIRLRVVHFRLLLRILAESRRWSDALALLEFIVEHERLRMEIGSLFISDLKDIIRYHRKRAREKEEEEEEEGQKEVWHFINVASEIREKLRAFRGELAKHIEREAEELAEFVAQWQQETKKREK